MDDDLPFNGVKVLDLSQGVAAPYCGMMLARNGASVIKVEPPGTGCWSRQLGKHKGDQTAHSVVVHRGKRSLGLNLKKEEGLKIAKKIAAQCNVVLQNYRVGKIDKFGLDYGRYDTSFYCHWHHDLGWWARCNKWNYVSR